MAAPRQQTIRVTGEPAPSAPETGPSWRLRIGRLWDRTQSCDVVLRAYFEEGWIAVVRADEWDERPPKREVDRLRNLLRDNLDDAAARDVRRTVACAVYNGRFSSGKLTIPKEIVFLLREDNPKRDVTVINVGPYLEVWPTLAWQQRMRPRPKRVRNAKRTGARSPRRPTD